MYPSIQQDSIKGDHLGEKVRTSINTVWKRVQKFGGFTRTGKLKSH